MRVKVRKIDWRPADWLRDTAGLKADVKGVYIDILSLIYSDGRSINKDDIRLYSLIGNNKTVIKRCINELIERNFIKEINGKLTNFRAENELKVVEKRIETSQENGKKGGRPSIKTNTNQTLTNPSSLENEKLTSNYQLLTINKQLEEEKKDEFNVFWKAYGKKVQKKKTEILFFKVIKEGTKLQTLLDGIKILQKGIEQDKIKGFQRSAPSPFQWLKDERWTDELTQETNTLALVDEPDVKWRRNLDWYTEKGTWLSAWGDKPDSKFCECPKHILKEYGLDQSNKVAEKKVSSISEGEA
tara:strand:+ start:2449 stop:3348 length:900 start_codon:yes stop_codon:yes gene_type:complete